MHIQYFGLSSFKFTTKEATVITDPFSKESGLTPPRGAADILILGEKDHDLFSAVSGISGEPFTVEDPGEYDLKGVSIAGIPIKHDNRHIVMYLIESEGIKVLSLGHIKDFSVSEDELESLGDIDVLIVPVGGGETLDASSAAKVVNQVEPRIVIPSFYQTPGLKIPAEPLDKFIKEMGGKSEQMDKLVLKKKDLVGDDTKVIVLEPLR